MISIKFQNLEVRDCTLRIWKAQNIAKEVTVLTLWKSLSIIGVNDSPTTIIRSTDNYRCFPPADCVSKKTIFQHLRYSVLSKNVSDIFKTGH